MSNFRVVMRGALYANNIWIHYSSSFHTSLKHASNWKGGAVQYLAVFNYHMYFMYKFCMKIYHSCISKIWKFVLILLYFRMKQNKNFSNKTFAFLDIPFLLFWNYYPYTMSSLCTSWWDHNLVIFVPRFNLTAKGLKKCRTIWKYRFQIVVKLLKCL